MFAKGFHKDEESKRFLIDPFGHVGRLLITLLTIDVCFFSITKVEHFFSYFFFFFFCHCSPFILVFTEKTNEHWLVGGMFSTYFCLTFNRMP